MLGKALCDVEDNAYQIHKVKTVQRVECRVNLQLNFPNSRGAVKMGDQELVDIQVYAADMHDLSSVLLHGHWQVKTFTNLSKALIS